MNPIDRRIAAQSLMSQPTIPQPAESVSETAKADSKDSFGQWLQRSLTEVNGLQQEADLSAQQLIAGENKDIHGTMIAMQKASVSLKLAMQVRNKVISAYEEIKRMQF